MYRKQDSGNILTNFGHFKVKIRQKKIDYDPIENGLFEARSNFRDNRSRGHQP